MGLWRFIVTIYGEEQLWVPETPREWPQEAEFPPCGVCMGRLTRRQYTFVGKDHVEYSGYRYNICHYGMIHDRQPAERRQEQRRKTA